MTDPDYICNAKDVERFFFLSFLVKLAQFASFPFAFFFLSTIRKKMYEIIAEGDESYTYCQRILQSFVVGKAVKLLTQM